MCNRVIVTHQKILIKNDVILAGNMMSHSFFLNCEYIYKLSCTQYPYPVLVMYTSCIMYFMYHAWKEMSALIIIAYYYIMYPPINCISTDDTSWIITLMSIV